jgi:RNA polymerase subunit RPABC4/transcription elongation factor Spt4
MSPQKKSSGGLAILVLVIAAAFLLITPFFRFSCSRVMLHDFFGMHPGELSSDLLLYDLGVARLIPLIIMFVLTAAVSLWVYRDAERRNHNGLLWGLFVFLGSVIGLIIYLIVRATDSETPVAQAPTSTAACPSCHKPVQNTYVACPYCGSNLSQKCAHCGKPAELDWKVCPYCGESMDG